MRFWAIVLACLLGSWSEAAIARCSLPVGWSTVMAKSPHFIVFGEMHGTAEMPATFGDAASALAERHERLLVAVELDDNAGLQRVWSVPQSRFAPTVRAEMPEWATGNDGRTSSAMFAMLVRLHALKEAGRAIDIVAFNDTADLEAKRFKDLQGQGPHEAGQAENIRVADKFGAHDRVLILVGNAHARKRPIARGGVTYEPMAMRLADPKQIVSLYLTQSGGGMWGCQMKGSLPKAGPITPAMVDCSAHVSAPDVDWVGQSRIVDTHGTAGAANPDGAFDATFFVGPITASPPAIAQP